MKFLMGLSGILLFLVGAFQGLTGLLDLGGDVDRVRQILVDAWWAQLVILGGWALLLWHAIAPWQLYQLLGGDTPEAFQRRAGDDKEAIKRLEETIRTRDAELQRLSEQMRELISPEYAVARERALARAKQSQDAEDDAILSQVKEWLQQIRVSLADCDGPNVEARAVPRMVEVRNYLRTVLTPQTLAAMQRVEARERATKSSSAWQEYQVAAKALRTAMRETEQNLLRGRIAAGSLADLAAPPAEILRPI